MEICDLPAHVLCDLIRLRKITALEATESALNRISAVDGSPGRLEENGLDPSEEGKVHAFITLLEDRARTRAQEIDTMLDKGQEPGPLAGIPFTVKDIFCAEGTPSTAGSRILATFTSPYTATPVARMLAAGGVMLGKVNLDEFTYGSSSESSAFKPTPRNPWNTRYVPGGSSGGSAAAVVAGEGQLSLGTDTAGSIRQPAAFCGVVGVKPTYGRVSRYGLIAFGSSLDCPGPLARNVTDAAIMLKVIAGPDPHDSTAANLDVPDFPALLGQSIRGLRIGLSPDYFRITFPEARTGNINRVPISEEIKSAVLRVAGRLAELGADILEDIPMPHTQFGVPAYFVISRVEAASNLHRYDGVKYGFRNPEDVENLHEMYRKSRNQGFGSQPKLRILMGMYVSAAQYNEHYYTRALKVRTLIRKDFEHVFDRKGPYRLDALLTPTTPTTAFPMGNVYGDSVLMQYADQLTVPANHAGVPGISIPCGFDLNGLPIGIQLLGPDFSEDILLRIGRAYEKVTAEDAWRNQEPKVLKGLSAQ